MFPLKNNRQRDLELKKKWRDENREHRKNYEKEYNKIPIVKEKRRIYFREYLKKHPKKLKQSKEYIKKYMKEYLKDSDNHQKYLVRQRDYHKLRKRIISIKKTCEVCGGSDNLEMHHKEYISGIEQNIFLLCRTHHRELHRKNKIKLQIGGKTNGNFKGRSRSIRST